MSRKPTLDSIFDKLDREALVLLNKKGDKTPGIDGENDTFEPISTTERARIFGVVSSYALERLRMSPRAQRPQQGKFHELKQQFHGNAPASGAGAPNGSAAKAKAPPKH